MSLWVHVHVFEEIENANNLLIRITQPIYYIRFSPSYPIEGNFR